MRDTLNGIVHRSEISFLLRDTYARREIAQITSLVESSFVNGFQHLSSYACGPRMRGWEQFKSSRAGERFLVAMAKAAVLLKSPPLHITTY